MVKEQKTADVSFESLLKIFTVPEGPDSTLTKIDESLSRNLNQFLREHIVAEEKPLREIEKDFSSAQIPEQPEFVSDHTEHLLDTLVSHSVHTSSPSFIGHMTSALPYFLMPLSKIMIALNQNLVKIETSKAFTPLERQVLGMLHRLIYGQNDTFYNQWMHSANHSLGAFCSGGTIANITALWVARNKALRANGSFKGVEKELAFSMKHYGYDGLAVLVSERGHYSLKKAADVLGLGQEGLVAVKTDANNRIIVDDLKAKIVELEKQNIKPIAVIGVAGTTETGNVDPLPEIAEVCQAHGCHFHVDAAWGGGATLMSNHHRHLLKGVEMADSVTIDAHKQLYIPPMGAGMVLFKDPDAMKSIEHHAQYILRKGSKDLGSHTLEGSRSGMAMLVYAAMHIISRPGYELLIDQSIEKARYFADLIKQQDDFELVSEPELCLLTYRYLPPFIREALAQAEGSQKEQLNELINELTQFIQKRQRETGKSFVSRTRLNPDQWQRMNTIVFRVVLANPLTTKEILSSVLDEQREIAKQAPNLMKRIQQLVVDIQSS
ncbi:LOW QUALITY PROTEIN: glutamate decarboxylase [Vibrio sp. JCM 18904]|nr:LOW QUALITY PROTEIN: glutamate decarboxylase [Vibrio sp. JCM 18904]